MSSLINDNSAAMFRWCFLSSRVWVSSQCNQCDGSKSNPNTNHCLELWPFNLAISSAQTEQVNAMATIQIQ